MGQVIINDEYLKSTANSIRSKLGNNNKLTPEQFSSAIDSIDQENPYPAKGLIIKSFDSNGFPFSVDVVGLTKIPDYYFYDSIKSDRLFKNIKTLIIPQDITAIGTRSFYYCSNLSSIELPDNIKKMGEYCFYYCTNLILTKLPSNLQELGNYAFYGCSKVNIKELPSDILTLGTSAFYGCTGITELTIEGPDNILQNSSIFYGCSNLQNLVLGDNLTDIGTSCFNGCGKLELNHLPSNLKVLKYQAFNNCSKITISELPETLETFEGAFTGCPLVSINKLPSNLKIIGQYALNNVSANISELPETVEKIEKYAFRDNQGITLSKLPDVLTTIGEYSFNNTPVTFNKIPKGVIKLDSYCLQKCLGITELTIEGPITFFGYSVFANCTNLKKLIMPRITKVPTFGSSMFNSSGITSSSGEIKVPHNLINTLKTASNWSTYKNIISGIDLESIHVKNDNINSYKENSTIEILYNEDLKEEALGEYAGYTLTCSDNATLDGNVLTLNEGVQVGDVVTVTATSTYNPEITTTKELEVVYNASYITVDLHDGQWVDSGTTIDGNIVYKSDAGSYHISSGKSIATIEVFGYNLLKLYIRSYGEPGYDYIEAFEIDTPAERAKGKFNTKGTPSSSSYKECIYELDGNKHTIDIMYSKDSGGNNNDDRGYFYIGELE